MKISTICKRLFCFGLIVFLSSSLLLKPSGAPQTVKNKSLDHALIIGISEYKNWSYLDNALKKGMEVGMELESRGFDVNYKSNVTLIELENALKEFFYNEQIDEQSRLFLWYSGHGHTIKGEGFLVPTDAPGKEASDFGFIRNALPVKRFEEYAKYTKAKHVYMVFDSCFSSPIFIESTGKSPGTKNVKKNQVRQFLCSCKSGKQEQSNVRFRDLFLRAIRNEVKVDTNKKDYISATEIGQFIKQNMENIPYYGSLKGYDQAEFEFILKAPQKSTGFFQDVLKDGGKGPDMVEVPPGTFLMGTPKEGGYDNEKNQHVEKVEGFAVGRFEVTFAEYDRFCEAVGLRKPDDNGWGRGNRPVINVNWEDALAYTRWLSAQIEQNGYKYRLPTEAEWEYMARAGTETNYWWGNESGQNNASCHGCGAKWGWDAERKTAPVGSFAPNPFGIYDTVGNVWELTCSQYTDSYIGKETECLKKIITGGEAVVLRGGSWDEKPKDCRVSRRKFGYPGSRSDNVGFRVVRKLKKED